MIYWGWHDGVGLGSWGIVMMVLMGLFTVAPIVGIILLVRYLIQKDDRDHSGLRSIDDPMEIIKRRYAAGEITKEQYEEMRRTLLDSSR